MGKVTFECLYRQTAPHTIVPGCVMRLPEDGLARASSLSESPEIDLIGTPEAPISEATAEALRYHPVIILSVPKKGDASEPKLVTFAVISDIQKWPLRMYSNRGMRDLIRNFVPIDALNQVLTSHDVQLYTGHREGYHRIIFNMHVISEAYTLPADHLFNFERAIESRPYQYRLSEESFGSVMELFPEIEKMEFVPTEEVNGDINQPWRRE